MKTLYILNAPVLTTFGSFTFQPTTVASAREAIADADQVVSAVGHVATADVISRILGVKVEAKRIEVRQMANEDALIFRLKRRPEEGRILTESELEKIGYEFAFLTKTEDFA